VSLQDELRTDRAAARGGSTHAGGRGRRRLALRLDLVLAAIVLVGPALALLGWAAARQRVGDLEERLVRDAEVAYGAPRVRAVHAGPPLPGSLADAVARHLPAIDAAFTEVEQDDPERKVLRAVVAGNAPASALRPVHRAVVTRLRGDLDGLLAGSRAVAVGLVGWADASPPFPEPVGRAYQFAGLLAGARVRLALAAGDTDAALRDCEDALGLARDASVSGGLIGHMVGVAMVARLTPACGAVLSALPPSRLPDAIRRLRAVRDAFPTPAAMLREEAIAFQIMQGRFLAPGLRERIPERARVYWDLSGPEATSSWERALARDAWRVAREALDRVAAAADRPDADRAAVVADVEAGLARRMNVVLLGVPLGAYLKFARRAENARRRLDALVVAATARGSGAAGVAELASAGFLTAAEAERCAAFVAFDAGADGTRTMTAKLLATDPAPAERVTVPIGAAASGARLPPGAPR